MPFYLCSGLLLHIAKENFKTPIALCLRFFLPIEEAYFKIILTGLKVAGCQIAGGCRHQIGIAQYSLYSLIIVRSPVLKQRISFSFQAMIISP